MANAATRLLLWHCLVPEELCPKEHDHQATGQSLRYKTSQCCIDCSKERDKRVKGSRDRIYPGRNDPTPDGVTIPEGFYLGLLCKRNHDYLETGYTLRSRDGRTCADCRQVTGASSESKTRLKEWRSQNPDYNRQYGALYYQANKKKLILRAKEYQNSPRGKLSKKVQTAKRRSRMRLADRVPYSAKQLEQRFSEFNNQCVYCDRADNLTADHVIPIAKGGVDALTNIVPACLSCNASKQDRDYVLWFQRSEHFSTERLRMISTAINDSNTLINSEKHNEP